MADLGEIMMAVVVGGSAIIMLASAYKAVVDTVRENREKEKKT